MSDLDAAVLSMVREFGRAGWAYRARAGRLAAAIGAGGQRPTDMQVVGALRRLRRHGPRCRGCGCTDLEGCPEGCWWVEPDLCSSCARKAATR